MKPVPMTTITDPVLDPADYRRVFQRTLTRWAMDVLALRRRGLEKPGFRDAGSDGGGEDEHDRE